MPKVTVLCSQEGATDPKPDESNPRSRTLLRLLRFEVVAAVTVKSVASKVVYLGTGRPADVSNGVASSTFRAE